MTKENPSGQPDHDVVIVGLGPTGATLANILGEYGLDVVVLEREASVYPLPRAVHFDDEAMRVFQSIGLADAIGRDARVNVGTKFVDSNMDLMLDWSGRRRSGLSAGIRVTGFTSPTSRRSSTAASRRDPM